MRAQTTDSTEHNKTVSEEDLPFKKGWVPPTKEETEVLLKAAEKAGKVIRAIEAREKMTVPPWEASFDEKFVRSDGLMDKYTWDEDDKEALGPDSTANQIKNFIRSLLSTHTDKLKMDYLLAFGAYWPLGGKDAEPEVMAKEVCEGLKAVGRDEVIETIRREVEGLKGLEVPNILRELPNVPTNTHDAGDSLVKAQMVMWDIALDTVLTLPSLRGEEK